MLTETVDRYDANFNVVGDPSDPDQQIGLITAFLNPLAFAASGPTPEEATSAIVRGVTRQVGNEIDEFVTEALRNNLLGLPLDLPAINIARGRDTGIPSLNAVRREIYEQTGESQLKPYISWADLVQHLKHPESVINFIAAYGTHASITGATTLDAKRAAAVALVLGGAGAPADRLDFLNGTGAYANLANGVTITGVDAIDLWIGGLAEENNAVRRHARLDLQLRLREPARKAAGRRPLLLSGAHGGSRLQRRAREQLVRQADHGEHRRDASSGARVHDAGLHARGRSDQAVQRRVSASADPTGDDASDAAGHPQRSQHGRAPTPTISSTPATTMSCSAAPSGNDILIAGAGDDTIWGDGGNDRIDGGDGNDQLRGGAGDDIITDAGGDDNIQGGDGNDVIHGGNGVNLIIGGFGSDFIVTGEDANESIGGPGNDFILGTKADEQNMGNEGDDWIEGGTSDGAPGDNFDPLGNDPIIGNDVYIGRGENDKFNAEGGDDIMVGSPGMGDRYIGASGFDWATFKNDTLGVTIDMSERFFDQPPVPGSGASILVRFDAVEGLSGSAHADALHGDDVDAAALRTAGAQGSVLTNIASRSMGCRISSTPRSGRPSPSSTAATSSSAATAATSSRDAAATTSSTATHG